MILTSFNVRGLVGGPKFLVLKHVFSSITPDNGFTQDTMSVSSKACHCFLKLFLGSILILFLFRSTMDSQGNSGGLLCIWDPVKCDFVSYASSAGLILVGHMKGIAERIVFLNSYGPYRERERFWKGIVGNGLLQERNFIIDGDLNLNLSSDKISINL